MDYSIELSFVNESLVGGSIEDGDFKWFRKIWEVIKIWIDEKYIDFINFN